MKVLTCTGGAVVGDVLFDCWKQNIVFQMGKNGKNEQNSLPIYRENALPTVIPLSGSNGKGNNRYSFKCDRTVKIISLFSNQLIELRSNWKKTSSDGLFPKSLLLFRIENQEYRHNWSIDIIIVIRYVTSLIVLCERETFESIGIHCAVSEKWNDQFLSFIQRCEENLLYQSDTKSWHKSSLMINRVVQWE